MGKYTWSVSFSLSGPSIAATDPTKSHDSCTWISSLKVGIWALYLFKILVKQRQCPKLPCKYSFRLMFCCFATWIVYVRDNNGHHAHSWRFPNNLDPLINFWRFVPASSLMEEHCRAHLLLLLHRPHSTNRDVHPVCTPVTDSKNSFCILSQRLSEYRGRLPHFCRAADIFWMVDVWASRILWDLQRVR